MYSPLHEKVAKIVAKKKYAVTSCLSKKFYLPTFKLTLATAIIGSVKGRIDDESIEKMRSLSTYHHAYARKVESRKLTSNELEYMAKFYIGLKTFIKEKKIDLVILHNDTRWYHAIAVLICNENNIKYLVTEQGLIRPHTTVIDNKGVNAKANISLLDKELANSDTGGFSPNNTHDSLISMMFFILFILSFSVERFFGKPTILKYMHNRYSVRKYYKRLSRKLCSINDKKKNRKLSIQESSALLLLQLDHDSQFLMYSDFSSNQEVIDRLNTKCYELGLSLAIKKHPLDMNEYNLPIDAYFTDGDLSTLIRKSKIVVTINSSAIVSALNSTTPLFVIGNSMYKFGKTLEHCTIESIDPSLEQNVHIRKNYLGKLEKNYLLLGAGYDYCPSILEKKLEQLLN
ncbi:capsular polysaccharide export protein [Enterovibrio norvegicus DSM 15893]|uniref:Capsular polysaccharide export protein n=1 Tax=Enterovibrio norvegicus DSM 15893 TaxID=1121869 RepID=A0A1I5S7U2_9GAMM|nr:capsular polysaccharide export protein [Enterovibrio norvegicus DSM 15893]